MENSFAIFLVLFIFSTAGIRAKNDTISDVKISNNETSANMTYERKIAGGEVLDIDPGASTSEFVLFLTAVCGVLVLFGVVISTVLYVKDIYHTKSESESIAALT